MGPPANALYASSMTRLDNRSTTSAAPIRLLTLLMLLLLGACNDPTSRDDNTKTAPGPLPVAIALTFNDFYRLPVGPKGLEPTETLLNLQGKTVRVEGYMVQEEEPLRGLFMLTSTPVTMAELADGPADFLPPATLFVQLPEDSPKRYVRHEPGLWKVVGRLDLGAREETNGRVSYVRLQLAGFDHVRAPGDQQPEWLDAPAAPHGHGH